MVHQCHESGDVRRLQQMRHFMHNDGFEALPWLFAVVRVQSDAHLLRITPTAGRNLHLPTSVGKPRNEQVRVERALLAWLTINVAWSFRLIN